MLHYFPLQFLIEPCKKKLIVGFGQKGMDMFEKSKDVKVLFNGTKFLRSCRRIHIDNLLTKNHFQFTFISFIMDIIVYEIYYVKTFFMK